MKRGVLLARFYPLETWDGSDGIDLVASRSDSLPGNFVIRKFFKNKYEKGYSNLFHCCIEFAR